MITVKLQRELTEKLKLLKKKIDVWWFKTKK